MNPYRQMDIYGEKVVDAYRGRELYENPPHLYAVADAAYKAMKRRAKDTCIVISGKKRNPTEYYGNCPIIRACEAFFESRKQKKEAGKKEMFKAVIM